MDFHKGSKLGEAPRFAWSRRRFVAGSLLSTLAMAAPSLLGLDGSMAATPSDDGFVPASLNDGLSVAEPGSVGLDTSALRVALQGVRDGATNIHSVLVMRRGKLAAELYRTGSDRSLYSLWASRMRFHNSDRHDMRSVSKSVTSLLYGILLARSAVPGIETSVPSLYPDCPELSDSVRRAICIRHLLTMTAGLDWTEPSPVHRASSTDETGLVFHQCAYHYVFKRDVVAPPGEKFLYSGGLTSVLAEIMARSTKRSLRDIARDELFVPMGITNWEWVGNLYGTPMAAAGLRLEPRDLMKIGAMVLAGGKWRGRQLVPADWIVQSTRPGIAAAPVGGYGFQWWTTTTQWNGKALPVTAAIGNGGQRLVLVPDLDLVVVTTAGDYNNPAINAPLSQLLQQIVGAVTA